MQGAAMPQGAAKPPEAAEPQVAARRPETAKPLEQKDHSRRSSLAWCKFVESDDESPRLSQRWRVPLHSCSH